MEFKYQQRRKEYHLPLSNKLHMIGSGLGRTHQNDFTRPIYFKLNHFCLFFQHNCCRFMKQRDRENFCGIRQKMIFVVGVGRRLCVMYVFQTAYNFQKNFKREHLYVTIDKQFFWGLYEHSSISFYTSK